MRIGVVRFTNSLPLAAGLGTVLPDADLVRATPAEIAAGLERGTLDIGLVPVAALAAHPGWAVVPGLGIAAEGPVRSVLLLSRSPWDRVERLVLDPASRTSNLLARLWLREQRGLDLPVAAGSDALAERLGPGDATVAIGDDALFFDGEAAVRVDLGGAWTGWTGLPFVFAVWAGPGAGSDAVAAALRSAYDRNAERLGELVAEAFPGDAGRRSVVEAYLRHSIRYRLGPREERGLRRFLSLAAAARLLDEAAPRGEATHVETP